MPKINGDLMAVQEKGTIVIKLYHIKKKKIVRQFKLAVDDGFFDAETYDSLEFQEAFKKAYNHNNNLEDEEELSPH